jgi:hypothetical protein
LARINQRLPTNLVNYLQAVYIVTREFKEHQNREEKYLKATREQLIQAHPYKSKMKYWLNDQMELRMKEYREKNKLLPYHNMLKAFKDTNLSTYAFLMTRHIEFEKEMRTKIEQELDKAKKPEKIFDYHRIIWRPENWIIKFKANPNTGEVCYYSETSIVTTTTTRYPFWRIWDLIQFTRTVFNNGLYAIIPANMIYGPLGIKALFNPRAFCPSKKVNSNTGKLETNENLVIQSMISRLTHKTKQKKKHFLLPLFCCFFFFSMMS